MSILKSSAIVALFTLASRITGLLRDLLIANVMGASFLTDAFFVAFKLPNFFRRVFAEGAFNAAFIPSFTALLTAEGREEALQFAREVFSVLLLILLLLNAIFILCMPWLLPLFAPGFGDTPEKFSLTVALSRICFPYILFISLVSLLAGMLNALGKFAAASAAPILLNLCMIASLYTLAAHLPSPAHAVATGVLVAGVMQLLWLLLACRREGALPALLAPRITARVRSMLWLMAPAALGSSVQQLNLLIDTIIASTMPDAVSYLYYADRLVQLPIGMIGVAASTTLLPLMSRQLKQGVVGEAQNTINRAIELVLLFGLPASAALLAIAEPIIRMIYEHGAFDAADTHATYTAMMAFAAGLPAFLLVKVFAPAFYAQHDTKTPFRIAMICVGINLALNLTLVRFFEHVGMALATSAASWINCLLLARILRQRAIFHPDAALWHRLGRLILSSVGMVILLLAGQHLHSNTGIVSSHTVALLLVISFSGLGYIVMVWLLGGVDKAQAKALLLRRKG